MAAVALTLDVQDRTKDSPHTGLWVGAVLVVEFLPTVIVGLFLGPLLDRLPRRTLMIAADAVRVGVFVALPFAPSAGAVVGARASSPGSRPASSGRRSTRACRTSSTTSSCPRRTRSSRPSRTSAGCSARSSARSPVRTISYAINAASFVVSIALIVGIPARLLQSERALTRGYWRDLADGFVATLRSRSMVAVARRVGHRFARPWRSRTSRRSSSRSTRSRRAASATASSTARSARDSCSARSSARSCSSGGEWR